MIHFLNYANGRTNIQKKLNIVFTVALKIISQDCDNKCYIKYVRIYANGCIDSYIYSDFYMKKCQYFYQKKMT